MPKRVYRLGKAGKTPRKAFRELRSITDAVQETARERGTSLSAIIRVRLHEYLSGEGWDLAVLEHGSPEEIEVEWKRVLDRGPPKHVDPDAVDPGGTGTLF